MVWHRGTLVTLPKKTFIVDPCAPLNLCIDIDTHSQLINAFKMFNNKTKAVQLLQIYKTLLPFVYSHRAAAHQ